MIDQETAKIILENYENDIVEMTRLAERNGKHYERFHFYNFLSAIKAIADNKPFYRIAPRFIELSGDAENPHDYLTLNDVNINLITENANLIAVFNLLKDYEKNKFQEQSAIRLSSEVLSQDYRAEDMDSVFKAEAGNVGVVRFPQEILTRISFFVTAGNRHLIRDSEAKEIAEDGFRPIK